MRNKRTKENKKFRILFLIGEIVMILLTIALIPINIFICNFPEWLVIFLGIAAVSASFSYSLQFKKNLASKIINISVTIVISLFCVLAAYALPYWNSYSLKEYNKDRLGYDESITYAQAENDMNEVMKLLERIHPMFKDGLTDDIMNNYGQSMEKLENLNNITVNDLRREIQYVLNPMHDAHTTTFNNYPNDRYLKSAPQKKSEGYKIVSLNGMTPDDVKEIAKPYFSYEHDSWISVDFGSLASLDFYNISSPYTYIWEDGSGNRIEEMCTESDFVPYDEYIEICSNYSEEETEKPFVYYDINDEKSLAVLTLDKCTYNEYYIECVNEMFNEVKEKNIKNVAVDLRGNGGGNSLVANEFIKYLPVNEYGGCSNDWRFNFITLHFDDEYTNKRCEELTFTGDVYVLTDSRSFSSAMLFPLMIQDNKLGRIIGESPANNANGYGDVTFFYLKETGLPIQMSTKKFNRVNGDNKSDYIIPDFPCDGEDALETLYSVIS